MNQWPAINLWRDIIFTAISFNKNNIHVKSLPSETRDKNVYSNKIDLLAWQSAHKDQVTIDAQKDFEL